MAGQWVITDSQVRALLAVTEGCRAAAADDIFYSDVLAGLRELVACDEVTFQLMDVADQRCTVLCTNDHGVERAELVGVFDEFSTLFWQEFWNEHGCAGPAATGDYVTPILHSEVTRTSAWARSPMGTVMGEQGEKDRILLPLTPLGGTDRRLLFWRGSDWPDFTRREVALLALIRPHLAELHSRRIRELRGEPNLTPRQWEVVRQVATGASNTQIARTLGLSEATVRKHLENVFLRLRVQSRTEALACVGSFLDVA